MSKKHVLAVWSRVVVLGLLFLVLSLYILLASGFLGDVPGNIIGSIVSDDSFTLTFKGLHTDIFWNTSADSVIVTDPEGLVVAVTGIQIDGNLLDYLLSGHVDRILVDRLNIHLAPDPVVPHDQLELVSILNNIDTGIAASTDRLYLRYGIITESTGTIIDSMYIDASIERIFGVALNVDSSGIYLPGFGGICGCGLLRMNGGNVTTDGFTGTAVPGSLLITGILSGSEGTLDVELSGSVGTSSYDIPVDLSVFLEGSLKGKLSDLKAELALSSGSAVMFGNEASFEVDTLSADLQDITVGNLYLVTDDAELNFDGEFDIESFEWSAVLHLNMTNTDISEYLTQFSTTDVTGSVSAECRGTGYSGLNGAVTVDLAESSSEIVDVSTLHIDAILSDNSFSLDGSVGSSSGKVSFTGNGYLGPGWTPESWTMRADGEINDLAFLREFCISECPDIASAYFSLNGTGTRFGMNIRGNAGVRELEIQGMSAERVSLDGSLNYSTRNVIDGISTGMSFDGIVEVLGFSAEGVSADTASVEGAFSMAGRNMTADASLLIDSLRVISDVFHTTAEIKLDGDDIRIDGLTFAGSSDRVYTAEMKVETGDTTFFNMEEIRANHSKLRVITAGELSGFVENGIITLDTLWLDPPVGDFAMSGILSDKETEIHADIVNFDLSTFSTFSGLPADMSGVGNFSILYQMDAAGVQGSITGHISDPVYGQFRMDSVTVDVSASDNTFDVNGIYAWHNGVRSGLQMEARDIWTGTDVVLLVDKIQWLELEVNNIGDWLFYILPLPFRTMGASVSARIEYERHNGDYTFEMQASARISRLYITMLGIELPNVNFYFNYPDSTERGYNARLTLGSGSETAGNFSSSWQADIVSIIPFELGDYNLNSTLSDMEIAIPGMGAVICSGGLFSSGTGLNERPLLLGKVRILEGAVGVPQSVSSSPSGGSGEMPFDLSIDVSGTGDLWFRTNFADIEMALKLRIFTLERKPTMNGYVSAVRGRITLLQRDFQITEGRVNIIQGNPPIMQLNVTAETKVRSIISHEEYIITILITGDLDNLEITLTGQGPSGLVSQEDILTLLAVGLTYSEMQQLNSGAIRSEVENVAQTMLGSLLARNLRHEIGLDTFEISPELLSDTTSLVLNVGKYVLPDLYVSYKDDVFSADPGTVSAQYLFSPDFYVEGTTRTTIHGSQEPTMELHYTIRY
ncbi:MAG: translocation/assembly module TamB [Candidatus Aegiribacteria sp.]|nr:translocation/assembly module TamB [Candidatus Aegiribacteria sp.]